jgi:CRP-like cAMP-binding protein
LLKLTLVHGFLTLRAFFPNLYHRKRTLRTSGRIGQRVMIVERGHLHPKFVELFTGTFGFTEKELASFISGFHVQEVRKKELFLRSGEISRAKAYLNKGCARNFVVDEKGHERILSFAFEDWWLADFESYYSGTPGSTNVQMLEDSELLVISKEEWQHMERAIPKLRQWYAVKLTRHASALTRWVEDLRTLTPEARYLNLVKEQPQVLQRVPLHYVAAFLNIEPQSLSRMRKRLATSR